MTPRGRWIASSSDSSVFTSFPNTSVAVVSTVKRVRSCRASVSVPASTLCCRRRRNRSENQLQRGEEALELMRGKCAHDEIALRAPCLSLDREDTIDPHLLGRGLDRGQAPEAARPIP